MTTSVIEKATHKATYKCYVGDTFNTFMLTFRNKDRVPIDFTTGTALCLFKTNRNDADALAVLTLTHLDGITLGNDVNNLQLLLTDTQTAQLGQGTFYFQVTITQNNVVRTYADCVLILTQ